MLGYIEDLPVESALDLAPMTQLEHLELAVCILQHCDRPRRT